MEIFSHRFYKSLDDTVQCDEMSDNDIIVCFELPCHAQQSRNYKPHPDDPFSVPVFASEVAMTRSTYGRGTNLFGYPFVSVITQEQAKHPEAIYNAVIDRLQRWTTNARDLYRWTVDNADEMEPVQIPISAAPVRDSVTEIKENGDVVTVEDPPEGDIVDEKATVVQQADEDADIAVQDAVPHTIGFKPDIFEIRVQKGSHPYGVGTGSYGPHNPRFDTWEARTDQSVDGVLLLPNDVFYIEFDEMLKSFYFGDERSRWEFALWDKWGEFVHPELLASRQASSTQSKKGITLQDCLDEFTREEKLGEDDLWYCPRCKKHQQATKRFDLWKAPDVLVVHLKRFSNSRMLRDKIDAFVDFPTEGLDLTSMIGERTTGKRLVEQGVDVAALGLHYLDEPLVYDLFAVDEHMGGLGGGHYRAYALNHVTGKWYHFDDSYVTSASAEKAVVSFLSTVELHNCFADLLAFRTRTRICSSTGGAPVAL